MKRHLLFMFFSLGMMAAQGQTAYVSCDFESGIPSSFSLYDQDGNEPSIDMKNLGFSVGTPWIAVKTDKDTNTAACSTSWYKIAGQSDDWMVTPRFEVTDASALLRWKAMASDKDYRDGYMVCVSEAGVTPEDFDTAIPALSVKSEKNEWTEHEISLADYVGKTIAVAFVNNSKDKSCLYLDDIFAGVPASLEISSAIPRVVTAEGSFYMEGTVKNTTSETIKGFSINYSFNGGSTYTHKETATIKAGKEYKFRFESKEKINRNETLNYVLAVGEGSDISIATGKLSCYRHVVVAEEITGTWCGYCVRGIAAMSQMKEDYPDEFIGIAVHAGSSNWPDPMEMLDYNNWLFNRFNMSGYPHCTVNRSSTTTGDPGNIPYYFNTYAYKDVEYGLGLSASVDASSRVVNAHTDLYSIKDNDNANLRLAYVMIENDVHSEESVFWSQSNYYAGGGMGEMGGFEDLPDIVPAADMWYQDVARYISDGFDGIEESVPSVLLENEPASHDYTFTLPDNILNDANTELCVLLLNAKNGMILNADKISLADYFSGIDAVEASGNVCMEHFGKTLSVRADVPLASVAVYSSDGKMVKTISNPGEFVEISTSGLRGMYIVKASTQDSSVVKKYIF